MMYGTFNERLMMSLEIGMIPFYVIVLSKSHSLYKELKALCVANGLYKKVIEAITYILGWDELEKKF
jgi:hypothetical protein